MPHADESLDALTRLLADDGPDWLGYFAAAPHAPRPHVPGVFRGAEQADAALTAEVPVAIFHDVERGAGERREVTVRLVDTPLERGRATIALAFDWPAPTFDGGASHRASCRLLLRDDVLDVTVGDAACVAHEGGVCRLELRLGAAWIERDRRPDELLAALLGVLIILHSRVDERTTR